MLWECVKINPKIKRLTSFWLVIMRGLIFTHWRGQKYDFQTWIFYSLDSTEYRLICVWSNFCWNKSEFFLFWRFENVNLLANNFFCTKIGPKMSKGVKWIKSRSQNRLGTLSQKCQMSIKWKSFVISSDVCWQFFDWLGFN